MIRLLLIFCTLVFAQQVDHLLLTRVITQPSSAESFSIYNPTDSPINLSNYYICDDEEYYKMQTEGDMSPASNSSGFTAKFPDISIIPGDTLHIILNGNYNEFYGEDFIPDITMYGSEINSMIETESGSISSTNDKIEESSELIILFKWDGNGDHLIEDVDYFIWGAYQTPINKSGISTYQNDTLSDSQLYFESEAEVYNAYSRIGTDEIGEIELGGNGITGHDETSENFRESWEVIEIFVMGCTDSNAPNYNETAEIDDGSCFVPFVDILNDEYDCIVSSN
ncbi:uncharacterized protein METZ01_LOCUS350865, partial [marine metagenome]